MELGAEDALADEEGGEAGDESHDEHDEHEDHDLGGQDDVPLRRRTERRSNLTGRILRGHDQDAQDADSQLRQEDAVEAEAGRVEAAELAGIESIGTAQPARHRRAPRVR